METKHTPGPWKVDGTGMSVYSANERLDFAPMVAAACGNEKSLSQLRADARLIAAAPEMLEALKLAQSCLVAFKFIPGDRNSWEDYDESALSDVVAAIAKATGGAQ